MSTNAVAFERELLADWEHTEERELAPAVVDIALELRQGAEDGTPRLTGTLAGAWMAAKNQTQPLKNPKDEPGGDSAARAALAGYRLGEPIFVFNNDFKGYFIERGTLHIPGRHMLRKALLALQNKVVKP